MTRVSLPHSLHPRPPCPASSRPLRPQLRSLRDSYLLGSPLLEPFASFLLHRLRWARGGGGAGRNTHDAGWLCGRPARCALCCRHAT